VPVVSLSFPVFSSGAPLLAEQTLNGRLCLIVDELVRRGVTLEQARREFERQFIVASLKSNRGNFCRSARSLGVHRNTLRNKVSDLGIGVEDYDLTGRRQPRRRSRTSNGSATPETPIT
jgi:Bacterial regulatory protein, Fis family